MPNTGIQLLTLAIVLVAVSSELAPQLCLNDTTGGLGCRCTTSLTDLALPRWEVDCTSLNISTLPADWQISQQVHVLDLSRNKLSSLVKNQFSHWGNLEDLSLARNQFTTLDEDVFSGLSNLRILDLSYNMLTSLPPKIFNGLAILSTLNLEMNRLQELNPKIFSTTPHLDTLALGYNTALGKYLMKTPEFLTVVLQKNLSSLSLNNMSLGSIPNHLFDDVIELHHLSLADNPLTIIDVLPPSLESLNLSGIDVTVLVPGNFIYYPNLKKLQLDRLLHLKTVQENAFEGLTVLEVLTMENCIQLHKFDEFAFGRPDSPPIPLRRFSLRRSGLHNLHSGTIVPMLQTLEHLDLQGNPWRCDCNLAWLRQVNFSLEDTGYLRCFSPDEFHNELLLSLELEDFVCVHKPAKERIHSGLIVVMDVFLILIVLAVASAIVMLLWRRGYIPCNPRQTVGRYSQVTINPNRAELEWDDKDLDHVWSTPLSNRQNAPRRS